VCLLFAGNGIIEKTLKTRTQELNLTERVFFIDFQNQTQMPVLYQACDLFCLPSAGPGETWGLAVNEAMACGKAVLVSDQVGCAADLVKPGINGAIFKARNKESLLENLKNLLQNKTRLIDFGTASNRIIQTWSFKNMVEAIISKILQS